MTRHWRIGMLAVAVLPFLTGLFPMMLTAGHLNTQTHWLQQLTLNLCYSRLSSLLILWYVTLRMLYNYCLDEVSIMTNSTRAPWSAVFQILTCSLIL